MADPLYSWQRSPSLVERQATRRATPKHAEKTRAEQHTDQAREEKKAEAACVKRVWQRDEGQCRHCKVKVLKSLEYQPKRGETHHIVGRATWAVRFDPRNRILLCAACHELVERLRLFIVGTAKQMFTVDGKSYLNADCKLRFTKSKEPA